MSRKPRKGYFVRGEFVAEGSELDLELKAELKGTTEASKTDLKRESTALQALGEELLELPAGPAAALQLPEKLVDAMAALRRITDFEGRRRQMQFVGKLMRQLEPKTVDAIHAALDAQKNGSAADAYALHEAEHQRDEMIAGDEAVARWIAQHPGTDSQQLRALVRQARRDAAAAPADRAGAAQRRGRAYREIFRLVRGAGVAAPEAGTDDA